MVLTGKYVVVEWSRGLVIVMWDWNCNAETLGWLICYVASEMLYFSRSLDSLAQNKYKQSCAQIGVL